MVDKQSDGGGRGCNEWAERLVSSEATGTEAAGSLLCTGWILVRRSSLG